MRVLMLSVMLASVAHVTHAQSGSALAPAAAACPEMASALTALMRNDARLRDWPNLARYRDANRAVKPGESRVVFMGDSITDLWQQPRFGGFFPGANYLD